MVQQNGVLATSDKHIAATRLAVSVVPLVAAPVLHWGQLSAVQSVVFSYSDPSGRQKIKYSGSVGAVEWLNTTAVKFTLTTGHASEVHMWNGQPLVMFRGANLAPVPISDAIIECPASMVDEASADQLVQKAIAELKAAGFPVSNLVKRLWSLAGALAGGR